LLAVRVFRQCSDGPVTDGDYSSGATARCDTHELNQREAFSQERKRIVSIRTIHLKLHLGTYPCCAWVCLRCRIGTARHLRTEPSALWSGMVRGTRTITSTPANGCDQTTGYRSRGPVGQDWGLAEGGRSESNTSQVSTALMHGSQEITWSIDQLRRGRHVQSDVCIATPLTTSKRGYSLVIW